MQKPRHKQRGFCVVVKLSFMSEFAREIERLDSLYQEYVFRKAPHLNRDSLSDFLAWLKVSAKNM